jgi:hypothetical protein
MVHLSRYGAGLRFTFVVAAYQGQYTSFLSPAPSGIARRVPRNAGELFTWPSAVMTFYEIIK